MNRIEMVVADSLSRRVLVNEITLVKHIMPNIIKPFYRYDVLFSILFESLPKESRTQDEINKNSTCVLDA